MSRTCCSIWWLQQHRDGSNLVFFFCAWETGEGVDLGISGPRLAIYPLHSVSTYIYFIVVYVGR